MIIKLYYIIDYHNNYIMLDFGIFSKPCAQKLIIIIYHSFFIIKLYYIIYFHINYIMLDFGIFSKPCAQKLIIIIYHYFFIIKLYYIILTTINNCIGCDEGHGKLHLTYVRVWTPSGAGLVRWYWLVGDCGQVKIKIGHF